MARRKHPQNLDEGQSEFSNWWFENALSFPGEETSLGSGLPSHLSARDVPCPSSPSHGFLHHIIGKLKNAQSLLAITVLGMLTAKSQKLF